MPHRRITTITTALVLTALALASAGPAGATTYRLSGRQFGDMA